VIRAEREPHALAVAVVLAVFVQVYLIGAHLFGAGAGAPSAHKSVGFLAHSIELAIPILVFVAWLPRTEIILSIALAVVGTVQVSLAGAHRWVGALHPLGALVVLTIAALIAWRSSLGGRHRRRSPRRPDLVQLRLPVRRNPVARSGYRLVNRVTARLEELRSVGVRIGLEVVEPVLPGLEALDHCVPRPVRVMPGVLARRVVAAADVPAGRAAPEMEPPTR
jgi:hypothetical protein